MKPRRNLYGIHNEFSAVAGGLRRGCILIRNRNGWDDNVPWLAHRHAERWSGLPALGLHTCWPILVGGGGVGGGGVGVMITYLGLHTLVYRLWACTHAGPFWWVAVGRVG